LISNLTASLKRCPDTKLILIPSPELFYEGDSDAVGYAFTTNSIRFTTAAEYLLIEAT
jgi:hypothetical protein